MLSLAIAHGRAGAAVTAGRRTFRSSTSRRLGPCPTFRYPIPLSSASLGRSGGSFSIGVSINFRSQREHQFATHRPSCPMGGPSRPPWPCQRVRPGAASFWYMSGGGSFSSDDSREISGFPIGWWTLLRILVWGNPSGGRECSCSLSKSAHGQDQ